MYVRKSVPFLFHLLFHTHIAVRFLNSFLVKVSPEHIFLVYVCKAHGVPHGPHDHILTVTSLSHMLDPPGPHHSSPQPKFSAPSRSSRKPRPPRFWRGRPGPQPSARSYSDPPAPCSTSTARPQGQLRRASHRQNTAASKQPTRPAGVVWRQAAARRDARGAGLVALHRDWDRLLLHPLLRRLGRDEHPACEAEQRGGAGGRGRARAQGSAQGTRRVSATTRRGTNTVAWMPMAHR